MLRSIRTRLTFWYTAMLLAGLLAFAGWISFAVHRYFANAEDARVTQRLQGLTSAIAEAAGESSNALRDELREFSIEIPEGDLAAVRDPQRRDLLRAAGMPAALLWSAPENRIGDLYVGRTRFRALRMHVTVKDVSYDIAAATSTAETDAFLAQFRLILITAVPLIAILASFGGYWMSRRALVPVDELTSAARRISLDNLSDRLPVSPTGDELQRLGQTWNEMLERLYNAVGRMRQFTADASHELRTPISIIRTTAELALRRERDPAAYRQALEHIHQESEWMTNLAEDLLLLARSDAGTLTLRSEPVDLDELARSAAHQTAPLAEERGVAIRTDLHAGDTRLTGDVHALRRLIAILLDNAVEHTPADGLIQIETSRSGATALIVVQNSGEGIDPKDLPHLFERFYRGDPSRTRRHGAGLGLSIARSIAQAHGARLTVESRPGEGAKFSVIFDSLSAPFPAGRSQESAAQAVSRAIPPD